MKKTEEKLPSQVRCELSKAKRYEGGLRDLRSFNTDLAKEEWRLLQNHILVILLLSFQVKILFST